MVSAKGRGGSGGISRLSWAWGVAVWVGLPRLQGHPSVFRRLVLVTTAPSTPLPPPSQPDARTPDSPCTVRTGSAPTLPAGALRAQRGLWHQAGAELVRQMEPSSRVLGWTQPGNGRGAAVPPPQATRVVSFQGAEGELGLSPAPPKFLSPQISLSRAVSTSFLLQPCPAGQSRAPFPGPCPGPHTGLCTPPRPGSTSAQTGTLCRCGAGTLTSHLTGRHRDPPGTATVSRMGSAGAPLPARLPPAM